MSVKMKPVGQIKARLGIEPTGEVQKFFTNTCYKHMDKYSIICSFFTENTCF